MVGNRVVVYFIEGLSISGELRKMDEKGIVLYVGFAEQANLVFYPMHRISWIRDEGPAPHF